MWITTVLANLNLQFREGQVEGESKCDNQQHGEKDHFQKCSYDLSKHDDIDANGGELGTYRNQIEPGQQDGHHPNLPLELFRTQAGCPEH